jgi:hypothetical protein
MDTIEVEIRLDQKVDVSVQIGDVIWGINELPMKKRWNYVATIINSVHTNLSDMTDEQREIVRKYLTDKLELFSNPLTN